MVCRGLSLWLLGSVVVNNHLEGMARGGRVGGGRGILTPLPGHVSVDFSFSGRHRLELGVFYGWRGGLRLCAMLICEGNGCRQRWLCSVLNKYSTVGVPAVVFSQINPIICRWHVTIGSSSRVLCRLDTVITRITTAITSKTMIPGNLWDPFVFNCLFVLVPITPRWSTG